MEIPSPLVLSLGPTNTGKTYRALQRLREHETGLIGLPLRLLAREVYDKLTAELGESRVALVTGEEKRVPSRPSYWVCTVEAMPLDLEVDFLAIDEIQLAGHPERGHVFTDRLLHARGKKETWFLGSPTMAQLGKRLLPEAEIRSFPRLSTLSSAGVYTLGALPRRSAVVAFSAARVYQIAGRIKARRGGAAIVLGALSPRARNAQVAMYQAGEVDYLVATDAIGMGLNLEVDHVAFADVEKFDGRRARPLEIPELAQIAGRAGRYQKDGQFGVLAPLPRLPHGVELALSQHRFEAQRSLVWRSRELDYSSPDALLASLQDKPADPRLVLVDRPEDTVTLQKLARRPEILELAQGPEQVRLLWEVCQIPDYRKLLLDHHANLVAEIFTRLARSGRLDSRWLEAQLRGVDRTDGDIESLTHRIAFARTWTYVTCRDDWVAETEHWRVRTRALEDRLSDALHRALVDSFVDHKKRAHSLPVESPERTPSTGRAEPFAQLALLKARLEGADAPAGATLAERAAEAAHEELSLSSSGVILFEEANLGRLLPGRRLLEPDVRVLLPDVTAGLRRQLERRLRAFAQDFVGETLGPLRDLDPKSEKFSPAARGVLYQLRENLGTALAAEVAPLVEHLEEYDKRAFDAAGVVFGNKAVFVRALSKPRALERREKLVRVFTSSSPLRAGGNTGRPSFTVDKGTRPEELLWLGYVAAGPRAVRVDVLEKIFGETGGDARTDPDALVARVGALVGCPKKEARLVARALELL